MGYSAKLKTSFELNPATEGKQGTSPFLLSWWCYEDDHDHDVINKNNNQTCGDTFTSDDNVVVDDDDDDDPINKSNNHTCGGTFIPDDDNGVAIWWWW